MATVIETFPHLGDGKYLSISSNTAEVSISRSGEDGLYIEVETDAGHSGHLSLSKEQLWQLSEFIKELLPD
jgi:hypothetical protein